MEMRMKLRMLRTDRGGEFTSNEFTNVINYEKYDKSDEVTFNFLETKEKRKHVSRDVRFMETKPWDWDNSGEEKAYTYNPNSEEEKEVTISSLRNSENRFDDTLVRGFKYLTEIYQNAREVETETLLFTEEEPRNYKEASKDEKWIEAMEIELDSINKNNTWTLTTLPTNQKAIVLKWYSRIETIRLILALATYHGWQVHHLDVKSAFLHGDLKEEVYVTQPEGFIQQGNSGKVYKLTKALYGLRQAPRAWNMKLIKTLKSLDFKEMKEIDLFKSQMKDKFEMSDLGLLAYYLGIEVTQTGGEITIKQTGYINKILKETSMMESNDTKIPMDPGTKHYNHTRPDLSYSVGLLSRFMQDPKDHHLKAVKQVIRYIKGTKEHGIIYKKEGGCRITGYSDSSYGINTDQGKGTTGIVFYFGESPITCELTGWEEKRITLKVDNISAMALVRNPVFHGRSKHIDIRYHFIRECVENGHINVEHVSGRITKSRLLNRKLTKTKYTDYATNARSSRSRTEQRSKLRRRMWT
ncbi:zinc finger, CCHC-type containing protein [Tanacetum coccineum]